MSSLQAFTVTGLMFLIYLALFLKLSGALKRQDPSIDSANERSSQRRVKSVARRML